MEKPKFTTVEHIPQWAVCYLVNSDDSALDSEDKRMADEYVTKLLEQDGLRLVCPIEGTENSFCSYPAFGLPCDTVDFHAERLQTDATLKESEDEEDQDP